jgi:TRAP-type C4-dicarboxylate transport system permease small subunit
MSAIGAVVLGVMILLTVADVSGRYIFSKPIFGTYEIIGLLLIWAGSWGAAYCEIDRRHVSVSFLFDRLSPRPKAIIDSIVTFLTFLTFSLFTWRISIRAMQVAAMEVGGKSMDLGIPFMPFYVIFAIAFGMLSLVLLRRFFHTIMVVRKC